MVKEFCTSGISDECSSIDSPVSDAVTIIFGIVRAISVADGVIIITVGLERVSSRDGVFLVWGWIVIVFCFVSFSGITEVSVLVKNVLQVPLLVVALLVDG